jgi:hypothetical protein
VSEQEESGSGTGRVDPNRRRGILMRAARAQVRSMGHAQGGGTLFARGVTCSTGRAVGIVLEEELDVAGSTTRGGRRDVRRETRG